jgi:hypothetical protein
MFGAGAGTACEAAATGSDSTLGMIICFGAAVSIVSVSFLQETTNREVVISKLKKYFVFMVALL